LECLGLIAHSEYLAVLLWCFGLNLYHENKKKSCVNTGSRYSYRCSRSVNTAREHRYGVPTHNCAPSLTA